MDVKWTENLLFGNEQGVNFGFEGSPPAGPGRLRTKAAGPNDSLPPACEHDVDSDGACRSAYENIL